MISSGVRTIYFYSHTARLTKNQKKKIFLSIKNVKFSAKNFSDLRTSTHSDENKFNKQNKLYCILSLVFTILCSLRAITNSRRGEITGSCNVNHKNP